VDPTPPRKRVSEHAADTEPARLGNHFPPIEKSIPLAATEVNP
jgi:hypothetical protein